MNYFGIKLGLDGGDQAKIIDSLKSSGCETIQVSDGLAVRTTQSEKQIRESLKDIFKGQIEPLDPEIKTRFPS